LDFGFWIFPTNKSKIGTIDIQQKSAKAKGYGRFFYNAQSQTKIAEITNLFCLGD
jgi:hypothetical protein